jgi:hypothetical protein
MFQDTSTRVRRHAAFAMIFSDCNNTIVNDMELRYPKHTHSRVGSLAEGSVHHDVIP